MLPNNLKDLINYLPNTPLEELNDPWLKQYQVRISVKRDDLIDSRLSGNKLRKLKFAIAKYDKSIHQGILTFGGPWSNHLHAASYLADKYSLPFVAIVRGEEPRVKSDTLEDIIASGAIVHYVSRVEYREMRDLINKKNYFQHPLLEPFSDHMIIPEGGNSIDALKGVTEILSEVTDNFDAIYLAVGTGATLAGLAMGLADNTMTKLVGVAALKAGDSLEKNVERLLPGRLKFNNWCIEKEFHFGGFARINQQLIDFINQIHQQTGLVTEPVYTAKALFALYQHIKMGRYPPGSHIMFIHTGGLQGLRGFKGKGIDVA